jgi:hypothetical protein
MNVSGDPMGSPLTRLFDLFLFFLPLSDFEGFTVFSFACTLAKALNFLGLHFQKCAGLSRKTTIPT